MAAFSRACVSTLRAFDWDVSIDFKGLSMTGYVG